MSADTEVRDYLNEFFDTVDKLSEIGIEINPDQLVIMVLYSLPESFENFRCAIESRDELPAPEALRSKTIEESDARKNDITPNNSEALLANKFNWRKKIRKPGFFLRDQSTQNK